MLNGPVSVATGLLLLGQVNEGETQVINIRETDGRLGPLVFALVGLGAATLVATVVFWWLTRPQRIGATRPENPAPAEGDL